MKNSKSKLRNLLFVFFVFQLLFSAACSVPSLEEAECAESKVVVKEFYSYHFGNEMKFSPENLKKREKYLTPEFFKSLQNLTSENDVFTTNSNDFPKAFRVGGCKVIEPNKTNFEVVLFWKDENRSEQKTINVEAVRQNDKWLVSKILN